MLVSKLIDGVLVIDQGTLRRAFRPKLVHRMLLVWTFRYFASLPNVVLLRWQKTVVSAVVRNGVLAPLPKRDSKTIIGTVETPIFATANGYHFPPSTDWEYVSRRTDRKGASA